ncbi:MAG: YjbQ family protein [Brevinematales bacterium]|nr:YjbQ family protein [Brevinematales bacterium]
MPNYAEFTLRTSKRTQFLDITREIARAAADTGITDGICVIHVPHTTAGVTINENADPDVTRDIDMHLAAMIPEHAGFRHSEGNSDAHIKSSLVGPSLTVIIHCGRLVLGTWQGIYFCEFDGPRSRRYAVKCVEG